jgi:hypothetical protein
MAVLTQPVRIFPNNPLRYEKESGLITAFGCALVGTLDEPLGGVIIDIDGQLFPAYYGIPNRDIAEALKKPELENCAFLRQFSAAQLGPGRHNFRVRAVARDGRAVSQPSQAIEFTLGE